MPSLDLFDKKITEICFFYLTKALKMVIILSKLDIKRLSWRITMRNYTPVASSATLPGLNPYHCESTTKRVNDYKTSWAGAFRERVFPYLPSTAIGKTLFKRGGRPSFNLDTMCGLLIIQEFMDLTDQETVDILANDLRVHYALKIDFPNDADVRMCLKTFWNFRNKVFENGLTKLIFDNVTTQFIHNFQVNTDCVRMDSCHLTTNMKNLSRGGIFFRTIESFLTRLRTKQTEAFSDVDPQISSKYLKKKTGYDFFGQIKPSKRERILADMAQDVLMLVRLFENNPQVAKMTTFKHLIRLLEEQCEIIPASDKCPSEQAVPKDPKEVRSDSLQNPSDPDATFDGHKGKGYQAQIVETCSNGSEDKNDDKLSIAVYVHTEPAHNHDGAALGPALKDLNNKGITPDKIIADAAYGGDVNFSMAAEKGTELLSPVPGKRVNGSKALESPEVEETEETEETEELKTNQRISLADFGKDENGNITSCPMGQETKVCKSKKGNNFICHFNCATCKACLRKDECPVKVGKFKATLRFDEKSLRAADRRIMHKSPRFKRLYRQRSGIEATNSLLARKFGLKRLRYRGQRAANSSVTLKVLALNIWRIASFMKKKQKN
ncbi:MAG: transposase [Streptococcaceae bacterium]|jgi:IS5 family transposase|nr:transposase [Streptococcaceae bacterium]